MASRSRFAAGVCIATIGRANLCNPTDGGEWGRRFPNGFITLHQLRRQLNAEAKKRLADTLIHRYHNRRIELKDWVEWEIERAAERARQYECLLENARAIAKAERISIKRLLPPKPKSG